MIAIVTDNTVYITKKEARLYGVSVVSSVCKISEYKFKERYIDEINIKEENFIYNNARRASTSQPDMKSFCDIFMELGRRGYEILCITISAKLSGTYNTACIAANHLPGVKICVVDSKTTGGGMFILIKKAHSMINQNMTLSNIANELLRIRDNVVLKYYVDDLDVMKHSKRLGYISQSAMNVLNIKPIFRCTNGSIELENTARNGFDAIRRLTADIPLKTDYIVIHYIKPLKIVEDIKKYLSVKFPKAVIDTRKLGPVIGINTGYSLLGIVWLER